MKIIVCGAGKVGRSIVSYLMLGNNDIVVIDNDNNNLSFLAKEFDIQPILGKASHPEILEKAGAPSADMLIAVTDNDEVNMISCEVATALFNIPKKIARIDSQDFLSPLWGGLFNDKHIPIDLIISPEIEIAKEIGFLLKIPGMSEVTPLADNKLHMLAFRCQTNSVVKDITIHQLEHISSNSQLHVFCIIHNGSCFIPSSEYKIQTGDIVYFITPTQDIESVIHSMGMEKSTVEKVIIFGGNDISKTLGFDLEQDDNILSCKIIEDDKIEAAKLAKYLKNTAIIKGDMMSEVILEEAGISSCDATIAVTPHDKDNLLISLLSKQNKVPLSISLANVASYNNFIETISDSIIVDRSAVIISGMLQELRKAKIRDAYSLGHNFGEVWEVQLTEYNLNVGQKIKDMDMPISSKICAIYRQEEIIFPTPNTVLENNDIVILYVGAKGIKKAEKLFT